MTPTSGELPVHGWAGILPRWMAELDRRLADYVAREMAQDDLQAAQERRQERREQDREVRARRDVPTVARRPRPEEAE